MYSNLDEICFDAADPYAPDHVRDRFWEAWKRYKDEIKDMGYYVVPNDDDDGDPDPCGEWAGEKFKILYTKPGSERSTEELMDAITPYLNGKPIREMEFWIVWRTGKKQIKELGFFIAADQKLKAEKNKLVFYLHQRKNVYVAPPEQSEKVVCDTDRQPSML